MRSETGSEKPKKSKKYKPTKAEVYQSIAAMINHDSFDPNHRSLKERFLVTAPEVGSFVLIEEHEPGLARVVNITHIVACLIKHLTRTMAGWSMYSLDVAEATKAVLFWANYTPPVPSPLLVGQKSNPELCFHRLPWDYENANDPTPQFDDFVSRCTNKEALKCFIGSLFEPLADRSQYLWIFGDGGDGKGTLTTMLSNIFGPVCCSPGVPVGNDKFWTSNLHKKKLAIISECETASFLTSALFKALTGNDAILFENKGEKAFSEKPEIRFIFTSNNHPYVTRGKAHQRRLISCAISSPVLTPDGKYGKDAQGVIPYRIMNQLWWEEAPSIVNKCLQAYRNACPSFGPIPTSTEAYEEALDDSETYYDGLFHDYFELDPAAVIRGAELERILDSRHVSFSEKRNFRNYLKNKHGLSSSHDMHGKYWKGIKKYVLPSSYTASTPEK